MAWNEPENNDGRDKKPGQNDPWGNRPGGNGNEQGPPDLDELIGSFSKKLSGLFGGGGSGKNSGGSQDSGGPSISGGLIAGVFVVLALIWVGAGFYTVDEGERGVVLRFGQAQEAVVFPGLHWNPPLIDQVTKVNVTRVYDQSFSNSMLTEDDNIVDVSMTVQYQVTDARSYYLNVRDPDVSLQRAAEAAIRHEVGSSTMQTAMTSAREQIAVNVAERLQNSMNQYGTGIIISQVNIAEVQQPVPVRAAYDDVIRAGVDREAFQNEANAYANQVIPQARGLARRVVEEANAYRDQVVARSEGEAQRFTQLLAEYQRAPAVTRERLYLDTLETIMANSSKVLIDVEGGNSMMYLPLDQMLQRQGQTQAGRNNIDGLNTQDIRNLSNQVIQDIQARSGTSTTTATRTGR
jgi:modulator of FtsH protease HflK